MSSNNSNNSNKAQELKKKDDDSDDYYDNSDDKYYDDTWICPKCKQHGSYLEYELVFNHVCPKPNSVKK